MEWARTKRDQKFSLRKFNCHNRHLAVMPSALPCQPQGSLGSRPYDQIRLRPIQSYEKGPDLSVGARSRPIGRRRISPL